VVRPPGVRAITPESAIMMPESAITMPGIADHHPGTGDHDGLERVITFNWNARSRWAGLRMIDALAGDSTHGTTRALRS
jgi:hypothetical protein